MSDKAPETKGTPVPTLQWQQQGRNLWIFGEMIRGVVRQEKARVFSETRRWQWKLPGGEYQNADSLGHGVQMAEAALGVKD